MNSFTIPLCQVCIPGLHSMLGIFIIMFTMFEYYTDGREVDDEKICLLDTFIN